jgi:hypothetical protein
MELYIRAPASTEPAHLIATLNNFGHVARIQKSPTSSKLDFKAYVTFSNLADAATLLKTATPGNQLLGDGACLTVEISRFQPIVTIARASTVPADDVVAEAAKFGEISSFNSVVFEHLRISHVRYVRPIDAVFAAADPNMQCVLLPRIAAEQSIAKKKSKRTSKRTMPNKKDKRAKAKAAAAASEEHPIADPTTLGRAAPAYVAEPEVAPVEPEVAPVEPEVAAMEPAETLVDASEVSPTSAATTSASETVETTPLSDETPAIEAPLVADEAGAAEEQTPAAAPVEEATA